MCSSQEHMTNTFSDFQPVSNQNQVFKEIFTMQSNTGAVNSLKRIMYSKQSRLFIVLTISYSINFRIHLLYVSIMKFQQSHVIGTVNNIFPCLFYPLLFFKFPAQQFHDILNIPLSCRGTPVL